MDAGISMNILPHEAGFYIHRGKEEHGRILKFENNTIGSAY